jgi:hypothetical protein
MVEENTLSGACLNLKRRKIIHNQNESHSQKNLPPSTEVLAPDIYIELSG